MKFFFQVTAVALTTLLLQSFLPWWSMAVGATLVGAGFARKGWVSFLSGFLGVAIVWLVAALIFDRANASLLSAKVAQLFPTKTVPLLFLLTALVGGLVGGFASLTGSLLTHRKRTW